MEINKYFSLNWKNNTELASAIYTIQDQIGYELIEQLNGKNELPLPFNLKRIKEINDGIIIDDDLGRLSNIWLDYQPNSLAWPLISKRMKAIVEENLTGNEKIDWIKCNIKTESEIHIYFILRFNEKIDVLDKKKTLFIPGTDQIIKPVFDYSKIEKYSIFSLPSAYDLWKITSALYVSEKMKKAMQKSKLTGVEFGNIKISEP